MVFNVVCSRPQEDKDFYEGIRAGKFHFPWKPKGLIFGQARGGAEVVPVLFDLAWFNK